MLINDNEYIKRKLIKDRILTKLTVKESKNKKSLSSEEESENKFPEKIELKPYHNQCDN